MRETKGAETMKVGTQVLVHGKAVGTVAGIHGNGKRIQVKYPNGETRFVNAAVVKPVEAPDWAEDRLRALSVSALAQHGYESHLVAAGAAEVDHERAWGHYL